MKSADRATCVEELRRAGEQVNAALDECLSEGERGPAARMYGMLRYFMGFVDEHFKPAKLDPGRRFRSALCLFIAESYGAQAKALDAALAIELFHNFTLIHDDVEDRDEMRRGRPTVWKIWGVNHAINSGDALSLIVSRLCLRASRGCEEMGQALFSAFIEVIEGQYLDFELADRPLEGADVSEEVYELMAEKKSGALVGIAAEAAGIAAGKGAGERKLLREYGRDLGIAYQMTDDYNSVWQGSDKTGKDLMSDIREHKRTLAFLHARSQASGATLERLNELYSLPRQLTDTEVKEAHAILDTPEAREYVAGRVREYAERATSAAERLALPEEKRAILAGIVDMLAAC